MVLKLTSSALSSLKYTIKSFFISYNTWKTIKSKSSLSNPVHVQQHSLQHIQCYYNFTPFSHHFKTTENMHFCIQYYMDTTKYLPMWPSQSWDGLVFHISFYAFVFHYVFLFHLNCVLLHVLWFVFFIRKMEKNIITI